jgi:methylphosphotriester-DNA--protein-cysteine methyltransferase
MSACANHAQDDTFGVANKRSGADNARIVAEGVGFQDGNRLMRLRRYINQNLDKELDRKALATVSGVSVSHLHRVFRAGHGESLAGYVRRVRLVRAAQNCGWAQWTSPKLRWPLAITPTPRLARRSNNSLDSAPATFANSIAGLPPTCFDFQQE